MYLYLLYILLKLEGLGRTLVFHILAFTNITKAYSDFWIFCLFVKFALKSEEKKNKICTIMCTNVKNLIKIVGISTKFSIFAKRNISHLYRILFYFSRYLRFRANPTNFFHSNSSYPHLGKKLKTVWGQLWVLSVGRLTLKRMEGGWIYHWIDFSNMLKVILKPTEWSNSTGGLAHCKLHPMPKTACLGSPGWVAEFC